MQYKFFKCCNCGYELRLATELAGAKPEPNPEPIKAGRAMVPRSKSQSAGPIELVERYAELQEQNRQLIDHLNAINKIIYAKGALLGSEGYFAIRKRCCEALRQNELANDCQRIANPRCGGSTPPDASG